MKSSQVLSSAIEVSPISTMSVIYVSLYHPVQATPDQYNFSWCTMDRLKGTNLFQMVAGDIKLYNIGWTAKVLDEKLSKDFVKS